VIDPIRKERAAGVGSSLPTASRAFTSNVCWPSPRSELGLNDPESQLSYEFESKRHWNAEPDSPEVNVNVGRRSAVVDPSAGPPVIVVCGAVVSTVNDLLSVSCPRSPLTRT
jgi:hypothetical protein